MEERDCKFPDCIEVALPGKHFCAVHELQREAYRRLKKSRPGGTITAGLRGAAIHLLNPRTPLGRVVGVYAQNLVGGINAAVVQNMGGNATQVKPPVAEAKEVDEEVYEDFDYEDADLPDKVKELKKAWELLGLDSSVTIEDEVRKRQRQFAEILHSDKGNAQVAEDRLKEINAAASLCIASLKDKKGV